MSVEDLSARRSRLEEVEARLVLAENAIAQFSNFSQSALVAFEALLAQNKALTEKVIELMEKP